MALKIADTLVSCNPDYYGIVKAKEVSGHKFVSNLESLYQIPDCILSESKNNTNNDAIGQKWYVASEECYFQLINWENRKTSSGWNKDVVDLSNLVTKGEISEELDKKQDLLIPGIGIEIDSETNEIRCTIDTNFIKVVPSLPEPSEELMNKIYIVPATSQGINNKYEEYFVIEDLGGIYSWELFGSYTTNIDFSDYLKKEEANNIFVSKELFDLNNISIDNKLSNKVDNIEFSTKLNEKADKTYVESELENIYNKSEIDDLLLDKVNSSDLSVELNKKADKTYVDSELQNYYTKSDIDDKFSNVVNESDLITELDKKADKTYVDSELLKKVNEDYFSETIQDINDNKVDLSDYQSHVNENKESFSNIENTLNEKIDRTETLSLLSEKADKDIATVSEDGLMSSEDKQNLDNILKGNLKVVTPVITGTWKFFNYRGDTSLIITPAPDNFNPIIEKGYKAQFTGTYIWNHEEGKKDPTSTSPESNWISLPGPGIQSSIYTSKKLDKTTSIIASIQAPKTGLMVTESNGIILANGFDYSFDSRSVSFLDRVYFGKSIKGIRTIGEGDIRELSSELIENLDFSVSDVTCDENEYFVFAYPKELGDLNNITLNYVQSVIESFSMKSLNVINGAGLGILLNVYVSNNPGAFYDSVLNFY